MFCVHCGTKIDKDAKYCQNCGEMVNANIKSQQNITKKVNEGSIRKALKKDAILKDKKTIVITTLIIFSILCFSSFELNYLYSKNYIFEAFSPLETFLEFIISIFCNIVLAFGITSGALDISRGKTVSFTDLIVKPFKRFKNVALYYVLFILIFALFFLLMIIPGINILILLVSIFVIPIGVIYFYPTLDMLIYIIMDDEKKELPFLDALKQANNLVKGHRTEYYGMLFSFIGWFLLGILTLGILYIWLIPYTRISMANMYRRWIKEAEFESDENGISNGAVIGITIGGYFISLFVIMFSAALIAIATDYTPEYYNESNYYYDEYFYS